MSRREACRQLGWQAPIASQLQAAKTDRSEEIGVKMGIIDALHSIPTGEMFGLGITGFDA
jgi:hypothetical protein